MAQQMQNFIVLCFAAAINFPLLAITMLYLGSEDGQKKANYLLAGSIAALLLIGIIFINIPARFLDLNIRHTFSHEFDWVIALILIALGFYNLLRKETKEKKTKNVANTWSCFWTGMAMMLVNLNTLVLYVALLKNAVQISSNDFYQYLLLIISNIIITLMASLPILLNKISPSLAKKIFNPVNAFINKYQKLIISLVLFIVGGLLLYRSLGPA